MAFRPLLRAALARLDRRLDTLAPALAPALRGWASDLSGGAGAEAYFLHPVAFPTLLLPWWLEDALAGEADPRLQADLIYSSICGYYHIRLLDDAMDVRADAALRLLPASGIFHAEFQAAYHRWFPPEHAFWADFHAAWAASAEATALDAAASEVDADTFQRFAARKVSAAAVPLLAVCRRHGREGLPAAWRELFDHLCGWHQLHNDLLDWQRDLSSGVRTWVTGEAGRRAGAGESALAWFAREGMRWAAGELEGRMAAMRRAAEGCGSRPLLSWLTWRERRFQAFRSETLPALARVARVLGVSAP